ncbi:MAG: SDR family oxidoreductase [Gammaproteobacteria bacterium]|nr:SDR family oxidoreductase [Gammaproteobacteria bacterium]
MKLENKVAIVTGAASGIGLATAETFCAEGAEVVLADIDRERGKQTETALTGKGYKAKYFHLDVTSFDSVDKFKDEVLAWRPGVDIVANVAGWGMNQAFVLNTRDFWRKVVDINLMGPIAVTRAFLDGMMERKYGKVIVVASDAGRVGSLGETVYSGAKGGAIAFCKGLAREMARYNINVNAVCPGPTDTPLLAAVPDKYQEAFIKATPMRRLGKPQEVADAILFFAGPQSDFITGQVLSVNGGLAIVG